ncbi:MAG: threonine/serine exporter family protein [Duncaniella sp.]|nr:threonine/serine exporter family protein [Duncaniella sp.]
MQISITPSESVSLAAEKGQACRCRRPSVKELCSFLSRYSALLIGCGATCIRLEHNIDRIAATFGMRIVSYIMPRHISLSVIDNETEESVTMVVETARTPISFYVNTRLSELSWEIADGRVDFDEALHRFNHIATCEHQNGWILLGLVAIANASFCRLFGGDIVAMGIVALATAAGYRLKQILLSRKIDVWVMVMICSLVSSVIGATCEVMDLGTTPHIALATSVLYLVPGIPFLNSFSDMLYRHYICALSRFVDAAVLTACLSIGLCAGMLITGTGMF